MIDKVEIYWDRQDCSNEGWAYRAWSDGETIASGAIDGRLVSNAIQATIYELDLPIAADEFAVTDADGGFAVWDISNK